MNEDAFGRFIVSPLTSIVTSPADRTRLQWEDDDAYRPERPTTLYRIAGWLEAGTFDEVHLFTEGFSLRYYGRPVQIVDSAQRILRLGNGYLPLSEESIQFFQNHPDLWQVTETRQPLLDDWHSWLWTPRQTWAELRIMAPARCSDRAYIQSAMSRFPEMLWTRRPNIPLAIRSVTVKKISVDSTYDFDYLHLLTLEVLRLGAHYCVRPNELPFDGTVKPIVVIGDLSLEELGVVLKAASTSRLIPDFCADTGVFTGCASILLQAVTDRCLASAEIERHTEPGCDPRLARLHHGTLRPNLAMATTPIPALPQYQHSTWNDRFRFPCRHRSRTSGILRYAKQPCHHTGTGANQYLEAEIWIPRVH